MPNIIIRHLSGTRANQVEEFPIQDSREILIGREANAQIRFDADREDLVSRNHARIVRDPADPSGFLVMDLDSRNGTFVNRQRIYGPTRLQHGDHVQMGPAGPEFSFELNPPPAAARPTRLAEPSMAAPPTREAGIAVPPGTRPTTGSAVPPGLGGYPGASGMSRPVGRETVERLVGEVATQVRGESRKTFWAAVIGLLVVIVLGTAYFVWNRQQQTKQLEAANGENDKVQAALAASRDELHQASLRQQETLRQIGTLRNSKSPEAKTELTDLEKKAKADTDTLAALTVKNNTLEETAKAAQAQVDSLGKTAAATPPASSGTPADITPEQIDAANTKSVVLVEAAWKITDTGTGAQIYLYHHRNDLGACQGPGIKRTDYLPMFVEDGGTLYPVLSTLPNDGNNTPIVGSHSGTGFIVSGDGFFLTNRHVLAPWRATWNVSNFTKKTMGIKVKNNSIVGCLTATEFPTEWVPSEGSKMVVDKMESVANPVTGLSTTSTYSDRLKYNPLTTSVQGEAVYNVTFAKTDQRYRANSVTISEKHDIALGKVDLPGGSGKPVTMFAESDAIRPGQSVVVMGYPSISPDVFGVEVSHDMFTNRAHLAAIADPTLTTGPISKVISAGGAVKGVDGVISSGEVYQLGISTTGAGNSGGPVFDSKGRVVAVFYAGRSYGGATVTYAVPIKFGKELIDNPSVIK